MSDSSGEKPAIQGAFAPGGPRSTDEGLFAALAAPFRPEEIKTREGQGGRLFHYVPARVGMNRLDEVVGPAHWKDEYFETRDGLKCRISIRIDGEWVSKEDGGAAAGMPDSDNNEKSSYSDSFKRACVKWGIGRFYCDDPVLYLPIPNYPGYMLGSDGSAWSQWIKGRWKRRRPTWRRLKTPPGSYGYPQLNLSCPETGKMTHFKLHILMLRVFVGPMPHGLMTRHLNGNRTDNRIENLVYGTAAENAADTSLHGRTNRGTRSPLTHLTDNNVIGIIKRLTNGDKRKDLAVEFGVSLSAINDIAQGRTWTHIPRSN